jgi:uncharacterized protein
MRTPNLTIPLAALPEAVLVEGLRHGGRSVVALSGGVDSAVVAALAHRALGRDAWAVTLTGPSVSAEEIDRAAAVVRAIGIQHANVPVDPLDDGDYRSNPSNRCYFCRRVEGRAIRAWAEGRGIVRFLDGIHLDDLGDDRPGIRAMDEAGFQHPLLEAGWHKAEVRKYARSLGLPNWDAPSEACLASRIPHGQPVSRPLLGRIETAERAVRALGFRRVRVRVAEDDARVEVDRAEVARLRSEPTATQVQRELRALGFRVVRLDPDGYAPRANA